MYKNEQTIFPVIGRLFLEGDVVLVRDYRAGRRWSKSQIVKPLSPFSYIVRISDNDSLCNRHVRSYLI